ncbi:hypothetical protein CKA32_004107 [Geitlerinema sp. FC II]|nr:hypothetical protein CKA32_004107 [Geitlerinema sp. FC II]
MVNFNEMRDLDIARSTLQVSIPQRDFGEFQQEHTRNRALTMGFNPSKGFW